MEYQALYRQFRPEVFEDMIGQDAIVTALVHQVETGKLAHAYLFCGTRGTGKTSTARILARAVNCENPHGADPCNECAACRSILNASAIDVVEIDAASNTSVDNIREIREEVAYPPAMLRYKVYIIDEVHMLSTGAFNALLKTLEEPPEHVIFILATTEYHKVPATIIARCQRFDFKRISSEVIQSRIRYVCDQIGAQLDDDALQVISYAADGSMRDGLAILDKCLSYGNGIVTGEIATKILGIVDDSVLFELSQAIAEKELGTLIKKAEEAIRDGRDPILLTVYLIEHFRCILVASLVEDPMDILQMSAEKTQRYVQQAKMFSTQDLILIVRSLSNLYKSQKETPNPKVMLEIGLASICFPAWKAQPAAPVPRQKPRQVEQPDAWQEDVPPPGDREAPPEPVSSGSKEKAVNLDQGVASKWNEFLDEIRTDGKMMIYSNLLLARPQEVAGGMDIVFTADKKGNRDLINHFENIQYLEEVAARVIGPGMRIKLLLEEESSSAAPQGLSAMDLVKKFPDLVQIEEEEN